MSPRVACARCTITRSEAGGQSSTEFVIFFPDYLTGLGRHRFANCGCPALRPLLWSFLWLINICRVTIILQCCRGRLGVDRYLPRSFPLPLELNSDLRSPVQSGWGPLRAPCFTTLPTLGLVCRFDPASSQIARWQSQIRTGRSSRPPAAPAYDKCLHCLHCLEGRPCATT